MNNYSNLHLTCLTQEQHLDTCNYWYTVTNNATAHTAFTTREGLFRWLSERGLALTEPIPETKGEFKSVKIQGNYYRNMTFDRLPPGTETKVIDNGEYTRATITRHEDGAYIINHHNCNVKYRTVYNSADARKDME